MRRRTKPEKPKIEAKPPVARKSLKNEASKVRDLEKRLAEGLEREKATGELLQEKDRALTESLAQQTATGEILRVISSSPTTLDPVLQAVVKTAARLCDAHNASLYRIEGDLMRKVAGHGSVRSTIAIGDTRPITRGSVAGRVMRERRVVHIADFLAESDTEYSDISDNVRREGVRTFVGTPLLREGVAIGAITVYRTEVRPFSDTQVALLKTFADQAVIAIENVRLFKELAARNRDLAETLEQQTATAEILRVISRSPTDVQPVFDAIAEAAMRLCGAHSSLVTTLDGELLRLVAQAAISPEGREVVRDMYPRRPSRGFASGRTVLTRAIVQIPDVAADPEFDVQVVAQIRDFRSILAVPMLRDGLPIGTINVHKAQPGPFTEQEIKLLETFADQAVIAIENVRLFKELEARNRDLTATSDILQVIASSPTDLEPVFESIVRSAARVCDATDATLAVAERHEYRISAHYGPIPLRPVGSRFLIGSGTVMGRTILEGRVFHVEDLSTAEAFPQGQRLALKAGTTGHALRPATA